MYELEIVHLVGTIKKRCMLFWTFTSEQEGSEDFHQTPNVHTPFNLLNLSHVSTAMKVVVISTLYLDDPKIWFDRFMHYYKYILY
jgi:hypothetical protein